MAVTYGLTPQGFARKPLDVILQELEQAFRDAYGLGAGLDPDGADAKLVGIYAAREDALWQLAEDVYASQFPDGATDAALDEVLRLAGLEREDPEESEVWCRLDGVDQTNVPGGRLVRHSVTFEQYGNGSDAKIDSGKALRTDIKIKAGSYAAGATFTITIDGTAYTYTVPAGPNKTEAEVATAIVGVLNTGQTITAVDQALRQVTVAGNHASKFPTGKGARIYGGSGNDGVYTVLSTVFTTSTAIKLSEKLPSGAVAGSIRKGLVASDLGSGVLRVEVDQPSIASDATTSAVAVVLTAMPAAGDMTFQSVGSGGLFTASQPGAFDVAAGTSMEILTGFGGWAACTAVLGADVGRDLELDPDARVRREQELRRGKAAVDAVRTALLKLRQVDTARVYENDTDVTDADGRPPHSLEAIVEGGVDQEIAQAVWDNKGGGIQTYGNVTRTVKDSEGNDRTAKFSRPTDVSIYVDVTVDELNPEEPVPSNAQDLVKSTVVAEGERLLVGQDVVGQRFVGPIFGAVTGIRRMTVKVGRVVSPTNTTEVITSTERARFATSRVTVSGI